MPVSRKILIRVIGAPLLVAALCGLLYWGYRLVHGGHANYPLHVLVTLVALVSAWEIRGMCAARGIAVAGGHLLLAVAGLFAWWFDASTRGASAAPPWTVIATFLFL